MAKAPQVFIGTNAGQEAKRMAMYGHKDWIAYTDKNGERRAERLTAESIKRAMLAVGTTGHFSEICASSGHSIYHTWRTAVFRWRHARYFERHGCI